MRERGWGEGRGSLESVGVVQRLGELAVILTVLRTADRLDCSKLILGEIELALDHIGFAEILSHLRIVGIKRNRLQIIADPFVGATEFASGIAAIVASAAGFWVVGGVYE